MRSSLGFRLTSAVLVFILLITQLSFAYFPAPARGEDYEKAKQDAAKKVAIAEKLAKDCEELKEKAAAAKTAAEAAKKKAADLKKAAAAAAKAVAKEESITTDVGTSRTGKAEDEADQAAADAGKAADDAQDKARRAPKDKDAQKDAKDKEANAKAKEKAADDADAKAAGGYYGSDTTKARKAARAAERAARAAAREAEAAAEAAAAAQALVDAAEPCGRVDAAREAADKAIEKFERLLAEKIRVSGAHGGTSETVKDTETVEGWKKKVRPPDSNTGKEPGKSGTFVPSETNTGFQTVNANGLQTVTFDTVEGRVVVNLPDDYVAGDTISGTVTEEPKGNTPEQRTANSAKMQEKGYVVAVRPAGPTVSAPLGNAIVDLATAAKDGFGQVPLTIIAPAEATIGLFSIPNQNSPIGGPCGRSGSMVAINESCSPISQLVFTAPTPPSGPITLPDQRYPSVFTIPELGQTGRPVAIRGPYDGILANTNASISPVSPAGQASPPAARGTPMAVMAESRGKAVFKVPANVVGPNQITLNEGGRTITGYHRVVGVNLRGKTNLSKAETTPLTIEIAGLQGIAKPLTVALECSGVITVEGGMSQQIVIQPNQVRADGRYTATRVIEGVQAGSWRATGTVAVDKQPAVRNPVVTSVIPDRVALRSSLPPGEQLVPSPKPGQPTRTFLYLEGENFPEHVTVAIQPDRGVQSIHTTRVGSRNLVVEVVLAPNTPFGAKQIVLLDQQIPSGRVVADMPLNLYNSLTPEEEKKLDGLIIRNKWNKYKQYKTTNRPYAAVYLGSIMRELNLLPPKIAPPEGTDAVTWWDQLLFGVATAAKAGAEDIAKTPVPIDTLEAIKELAGLLGALYGDPNTQGGAHGLRKQLESRGLREDEIGEINDAIAEVYKGLQQRAGK